MSKKRRAPAAYTASGGLASDAYAERLADLHAALTLIGSTSLSRLSWLARFAEEKSEDWHSSTISGHGDCLVAMVAGITSNLVGGVELPPAPERQDVTEIHRDLKAILTDLVNAPAGRVVQIPTTGQSVWFVRRSKVSEKPAEWGVTYGAESLRAAVFQQLRDLIVRAGDKLIACPNPNCKVAFVAIRKQLFCTPRCAQEFRNLKKKGAC